METIVKYKNTLKMKLLMESNQAMMLEKLKIKIEKIDEFTFKKIYRAWSKILFRSGMLNNKPM